MRRKLKLTKDQVAGLRAGHQKFLSLGKKLAAQPAGAAAGGPPSSGDVTRDGVRYSMIAAGAHWPFPPTATLTALHILASNVKANLEAVFTCTVTVAPGDSENALTTKEKNAGC